MYLQQIRVDAFGHYRDRPPLTLGPGLVVIHGPNEAGKTTLRQAVRWALFDLPRGEAKRWQGERGKLAVELVLVDGGATIGVTREGRNLDLHMDGRAMAGPAALERLLKGTDRALFDAIFSFDLLALQQLEMLGDQRVQDRLALGATFGGGVSPTDVDAALKREQETLWRPRAASLVGDARAALEEAQRALREAERAASDHPAVAREVAEIEARVRAQKGLVEELSASRTVLLRREAAMAPWLRRRVLSARLEAIGVEVLPAPGLPERIDEALQTRDAALRALGESREALEKAASDRDAAVVDEAILAQGAELGELSRRAGAIEAGLADRGELDAAVKRAEGALRDGLEALGPAWDERRLRETVLRPEDIAESRRHATVTAALVRSAPTALEEAAALVEEIERQREEAEEILAGLAPSPLASADAALRSMLDEAPQRLRDAELYREGRQALDRDRQGAPPQPEGVWPLDMESRLEALESWERTWEKAASVKAAQLEQLRGALLEAEAEATEAGADLVEAEAMPGAGGPGEAEIAELRAAWKGLGPRVARMTELETEAARVEAARVEMPARLGGDVGPEALEGVKGTVAARSLLRRRFEDLEGARAERRRAEGRRAEVGGEVTAGPVPEGVEGRPELLLRARSAHDAYLMRAGVEAAPSPTEARVRWLGVVLLVVLGVVAAVAAQVLLAVAALVGAGLFWGLTVAWARRGTGGAEAELRAREAAFRAAGVKAEATRADLEVALAAAEREAAEVEAARRREAKRRSLEAEVVVARQAEARAREALDSALAGAGLRLGLTREEADAWLDAAEGLRELRAREAGLRAEMGAVRAEVAAFAERLGGWLGREVLQERAALEAGLEAAATMGREAVARGDALREARGRLGRSERAVDKARADLGAAEGAAAVSEALRAKWEAFREGMPEGEPETAYLTEARRARDWQRWDRAVKEQEAALGRLEPVIEAFEAGTRRLAEAAGQDASAPLPMRCRRLLDLRAQDERRLGEEPHARRTLEALAERGEAARRALVEAEAQRRARDEAVVAFGAWARRVGAPEGVRPEAAEAHVEAVRGARRALEARDAAVEERARAVAAEEAFVEAVGALVGRPGIGGEAPGEVGVALEMVRALGLRLEEAGRQRTLLKERVERLREAASLEVRRRGALEEAEGALEAVLGEVGCADAHAWADLRAKLAERQSVQRELEAVEAELRGILGPEWAEEVALDVADAVGLAEEREARGEALGEAKEALDGMMREAIGLRMRLSALEESAEVAERAAEVAAARARYEEVRRRWWRVSLARECLRETVERFRRERQPAVIRKASSWLAEATGGAYVALVQDEDDRKLSFSVVDGEGGHHPAEALSTGTTGLVYLCLRLALAVEQGAQAAALPIVADDVLAHFDPERAQAAARLFARVAEEEPGRQVILFTCRPETVAAVEEATGKAAVVRLPRWGGARGPRRRGGARAPAVAGPRPAVGAEALGGGSVEEAVALLEERGEALRKADFVEALGLDAEGWEALRGGLEADARVEGGGHGRGKTYALLKG